MYHFVFQISKKPIPQSTWLTEETLGENLELLPVADSVGLTADRKLAIKRFGAWLEKNRLGTSSSTFFTLDSGAAEHYFLDRFKSFQEAASILRTVNEVQFSREHNRVQMAIDRLQHTFCDPHDTYMVMGKNPRPIPMDEFIRLAEPDVRYYFGGVLDYHF